jgi:hypothetical protein
MKTKKTAKRRDFNPTFHRADTNVWMARIWQDVASVVALAPKDIKEERTNQDDHGNSKFAKLLDYALCSAIWPRRDDTVANPSDIENATHGLPDVKSEKGRLTRKPK